MMVAIPKTGSTRAWLIGFLALFIWCAGTVAPAHSGQPDLPPANRFLDDAQTPDERLAGSNRHPGTQKESSITEAEATQDRSFLGNREPTILVLSRILRHGLIFTLIRGL